MNTLDYIQKEAPTREFSQKPNILLGRLGPLDIDTKKIEWIHDHPRLFKISHFVFKSLVAFSLACPLVLGAQGLIYAGAGVTTTLVKSLVERSVENLGAFASPFTQMVFAAKKCEGGQIHYQGNVPILTLYSDNPHVAGKAHGYLCAPQMLNLFDRVEEEQSRSPAELASALEKLNIPDSMRKEMEGMAEGINQWIDEQWGLYKHRKVTTEEILLANLMPDSLYYNPAAHNQAQKVTNVACTAILDKNKESGVVFGRTMDWRSFGLAGTYTLMINRKYTDGRHNTVEVGVPGFVGTLTGMNDAGFSCAMNVCGAAKVHPDGIPSSFYNRMILENANSVKQAKSWMNSHAGHPLGSYHLSLADPKSAEAVHFYQKTRRSPWEWITGAKSSHHAFRPLAKKEPLVTTNRSFDHDPRHMFWSQEREQNLQALFSDANAHVDRESQDLEKLIGYALTLPYVNNLITTHAVQMVPGSRGMRVAADNSFAASHPLEEIDTEPLFS